MKGGIVSQSGKLLALTLCQRPPQGTALLYKPTTWTYKVVHNKDTRDHALIVTKEQATDTGKACQCKDVWLSDETLEAYTRCLVSLAMVNTRVVLTRGTIGDVEVASNGCTTSNHDESEERLGSSETARSVRVGAITRAGMRNVKAMICINEGGLTASFIAGPR